MLRRDEVEEFKIKYNLLSKNLVADRDAMLRNLVKFQTRVRAVRAWRLGTRQLEFDRWYHDCRRNRYVLTVLSASALGVLSVFSFQICLMAAAAFTLDQSVLWAVKVMQSVAMQLFITSPVMGLLMFLLKLIISWVLLRVGRHRHFVKQQEELNVKAARIAQRESSAANATSAAIARVNALRVVATGDERAVKAERAAQLQTKDQHEARLTEVIASKTQLMSGISSLKRDHPAAAAAAAAAAAGAAARGSLSLSKTTAHWVAALDEMQAEKLVLDADERRTTMLLNAAKVRLLLLLPAPCRRGVACMALAFPATPLNPTAGRFVRAGDVGARPERRRVPAGGD